MAPSLRIASLLAQLAAISLAAAERVAVPSTPQVQDVSQWKQTPNGYRFLPPAGSSSRQHSYKETPETLDLVLLASIDGTFHALNRNSGQELWSTSTSLPYALPPPSALAPLVRTKYDKENHDEDDEDAIPETYIIEPQTGDIYVASSSSAPLQRLPFSMPQLVEMSPFQLTDDDVTRTFTGRRQTSLLLLELETGRLQRVINSECPWDAQQELAKIRKFKPEDADELDLDDLEAGEPPERSSTLVYIGRTDYEVLIQTESTNGDFSHVPDQSLSFSTYGPSNDDAGIQAHYRQTSDDSYVQSMSSGAVISFKAPKESKEKAPKESQIMWHRKFQDTIVAVFDVVEVPSRTKPFVLLQPQPRFEELFPHVDFHTAAKQDSLPNIGSAYVGMVTRTGSLFAMSPDSYPLLLFGDGQEEERVDPRYLIDPPTNAGSKFPSDTVDDQTRQRRMRELCENNSSDRRCFIGMRPMEDGSRSRYSRLLEGVPSVEDPPSEPERESRNNTPIPPPSSESPNNQTITDGRTGSTALSLSALYPLLACSILLALWLGWKRTRSRSTLGTQSVRPQTDLITEKVAITQSTTLVTSVNGDNVSGTSQPSGDAESASAPKESVDSKTSSPADATSENVAGQDDDDSDRDDPTMTPGKRKTRRGRRGKKKKVALALPEDAEDAAVPITPSPFTPPIQVSSIVLPPPPTPSASALVVTDTVLGFGSHGTVVYEGSFQGRAVAVKRLLQDFVTLASREVSILQESDDHPNVIRYHYQETLGNFLYIALELCPASLADIIECPDQFNDIVVTFEPKRALSQITSGLRHLHALKIVHRDIKPQNILISTAKGKPGSRNSGHRMLISDFGLCKRLEVDQTSFLPTVHGAMAAGTVGWRAPEILRGEVSLADLSDDQSQSSRGSLGGTSTPTLKPTRLTKSVDIFALGCLFYYTLTNGGHPYGDRFEREANIIKNVQTLDGLQRFGEEGSEAFELIGSMLSFEAKARPDTTTILLHPYFWDSGRRLSFLQEASDRFEIMCREPVDPTLALLEASSSAIVGNDWYARLDKTFIENLGKFRKYDPRSVRDLLRALRNKKHHYQDLPDNVKRHLGPMPVGFLAYFTRRFPGLFLHVHHVVSQTPLRTESMFRSYFDLLE